MPLHVSQDSSLLLFTTGEWDASTGSYVELDAITHTMVENDGTLKNDQVFMSCRHYKCAQIGGGRAKIGMPCLFVLNGKSWGKTSQFKNAHAVRCRSASTEPAPAPKRSSAQANANAKPSEPKVLSGQSSIMAAFSVGAALLQQEKEAKQAAKAEREAVQTKRPAAEKPRAEKPAAEKRKKKRIRMDEEEEDEAAEDVSEEAAPKRAKVVDGSSQDSSIDLERLDDVRPLASSKFGALCCIYPFQPVGNIKSSESIYHGMVKEEDFTVESTTMLHESVVNTLSKYEWLRTCYE